MLHLAERPFYQYHYKLHYLPIRHVIDKIHKSNRKIHQFQAIRQDTLCVLITQPHVTLLPRKIKTDIIFIFWNYNFAVYKIYWQINTICQELNQIHDTVRRDIKFSPWLHFYLLSNSKCLNNKK